MSKNTDPQLRRKKALPAAVLALAASAAIAGCTAEGSPAPTATKTIYHTKTVSPLPSPSKPNKVVKLSQAEVAAAAVKHETKKVALELVDVMGSRHIKNETFRPGDIGNQTQAYAQYNAGNPDFPNLRVIYTRDKDHDAHILLSVMDGRYGSDKASTALKSKIINLSFSVSGSESTRLDALLAGGHNFTTDNFKDALHSSDTQFSSIFMADNNGHNADVNYDSQLNLYGVINGADGQQKFDGLKLTQ